MDWCIHQFQRGAIFVIRLILFFLRHICLVEYLDECECVMCCRCCCCCCLFVSFVLFLLTPFIFCSSHIVQLQNYKYQKIFKMTHVKHVCLIFIICVAPSIDTFNQVKWNLSVSLGNQSRIKDISYLLSKHAEMFAFNFPI